MEWDSTGAVATKMTGFVTYGFDDSRDSSGANIYSAADWVNPADGIGRWRVKIKGTVGNAATGHTTRGDTQQPGIFSSNS